MSDNKVMHVVAGVIYDASGKVLLAQRLEGRHRAGCWEFPGGKLHKGETVQQALKRELLEELSIVVQHIKPLIKVYHQYDQYNVLLDVWQVVSYQGHPMGAEGQLIKWMEVDQLAGLSMPEADLPVIKALRLPEFYVISNEPTLGMQAFLDEQEKKFQSGARLFQFRAKSLGVEEYKRFASALITKAEAYGVKVLLNADPQLALELGAAGVHLTEHRLLAMRKKPQEADFLVAASCHDGKSLAYADALDLDFAVLSPVNTTLSHPGVKAMGWSQFDVLVSGVNLPVYALGGMALEDLSQSQACGAQGVAGIRLFAGDEPLRS